MRKEFGTFCENRRIDVADLITLLAYQFGRPFQEINARNAFEFRIAVGKDLPDVSRAGAADDRYRQVNSLNQTRFVCAVVFVVAGAIERFTEDLDFENLWSLGQYQMFARDRHFNLISFHLLDGVDDGYRENGRAAPIRL